jgi:hypothetical protein
MHETPSPSQTAPAAAPASRGTAQPSEAGTWLPAAAEQPPVPAVSAAHTLEVEADLPRSRYAPLAVDPPGDWAVLHAGLRPRLGTFGGLATLALAHARTERFYGGLSLSLVRNDAGTHVGLAQIALGRNLADSFGGGVQLSITENRARSFVGLGQVALAYNRSLSFTGASQVAAFNWSRDFDGLLQLGAYNRTDDSFVGALQVGAFNHSRGTFSGVAQLGVLNAVGRELFAENEQDPRRHRFAGLAQAGAVSTVHGDFYGLAQVGAASFTSEDFRGVLQVGALGAGAGSFHGLAQIGLVALSKESVGVQLGGGAIATGEHTGLQVGALGTYAKSVAGAQIGVANLADRVRGVQIGVFNHAKSLRGVQIGLANHADDGVLPWTALLNFGFGDDDDAPRDQYQAAQR